MCVRVSKLWLPTSPDNEMDTLSISLAEHINIAPPLAFVCGAWRPKADYLGGVGGRSPPTDIARGLGGGSPPAESVRLFCPSPASCENTSCQSSQIASRLVRKVSKVVICWLEREGVIIG